MSWKCPQCGVIANDKLDDECSACGYVRYASRISLISKKTHRKISMAIDTVVGQRLLRNLDEEDSKYASSEQFRIYKCKELGGWAIEHISNAKNPTYYDTEPIVAGKAQKIRPNSQVSIGQNKVLCNFEMEY